MQGVMAHRVMGGPDLDLPNTLATCQTTPKRMPAVATPHETKDWDGREQ
jgi:hypothetical protein